MHTGEKKKKKIGDNNNVTLVLASREGEDTRDFYVFLGFSQFVRFNLFPFLRSWFYQFYADIVCGCMFLKVLVHILVFSNL